MSIITRAVNEVKPSDGWRSPSPGYFYHPIDAGVMEVWLTGTLWRWQVNSSGGQCGSVDLAMICAQLRLLSIALGH